MTHSDPVNVEEGSLTFLVRIIDDGQDAKQDGTKNIFGQRDGPALRQIPVPVLREGLYRVVNELSVLFRDLNSSDDGMVLREVEVSFEVTASGKIALLGASAETAGRGAITMRFEGRDRR